MRRAAAEFLFADAGEITIFLRPPCATVSYTHLFFLQMVDVFPFVEKKNFVHQGVVTDGNVITGIGMFYRAFAERCV